MTQREPRRRDGQRTENVFQIKPNPIDNTFSIVLIASKGVGVIMESPKHFLTAAAAKTVVAAIKKCAPRSRVEVVDENGVVVE